MFSLRGQDKLRLCFVAILSRSCLGSQQQQLRAMVFRSKNKAKLSLPEHILSITTTVTVTGGSTYTIAALTSSHLVL